MVYSLKSALTEKISAYPETANWGCIFALPEPILHRWRHCYTRCNPKTCAVRFSEWQVIFGPSFMVTEQYLVLVLADLHLFWTILTAICGLKYFLFRHVILQMSLKYPLYGWNKHEIKQGLQAGNIVTYLTFPPWGEARGPPHPENEIPNMALEWTRPIQIHSLI